MSKKIDIIRKKDIEIVSENIDIITERARKKEIQLIEPLLDEYMSVKSIIMEYIKTHKRIIYGGHAMNELIKTKSQTDVFYKESDYVDIEFYSNKPIDDLVNICNLLYGKNFKYIQGRNAHHRDTFTIFVNFEQYCDITYMPSNLYHSVMTETVNNYKLIHPKFMMVDILRQFNDPIISYRRLDKVIKRSKILINYFPLELYNTPVKTNTLNNTILELIHYLVPLIISMTNIIFIGQVAYNAYINPNIDIKKQKIIYENSPIILISSNLKDDTNLIYNYILKFYIDNKKLEYVSNKLLLDQYYPFFQFTDKHIDFKLDGHIFLTIYGNNEKCIPYNQITFEFNKISYLINIGTFNVLLMLYLIQFHIGYLTKNKDMKNLNNSLMFKLLNSRNNFLESNNKTVLDQTIFEDFKSDCIGVPVSPSRKYLMAIKNRKLMTKSDIQSYNPDDKKNFNTEIYNFNNYSGNIINNTKDMIYVKK